MTYDQYQQIYNAAKAQIADRVSKLQPRAGNNASVNGMGISIEVGGAEEAAVTEETWLVTVLGRVEGQGNEVGPGENGALFPVTRQYSTPFTPVAEVPRNAPFVGGMDATGSKQALYRTINPLFPEYYNEFRLFLQSSSTDTSKGDPFKIPLRVEVAMMYNRLEYDSYLVPRLVEYEEVATFIFDVGYDGDSRSFVAPRSGTVFEYYTLNIKSIERTA